MRFFIAFKKVQIPSGKIDFFHRAFSNEAELFGHGDSLLCKNRRTPTNDTLKGQLNLDWQFRNIHCDDLCASHNACGSRRSCSFSPR